MATENLLNLKVHKVSKPTYEDLEKNNKLDSTAIYLTPDDSADTFYVTAGQLDGTDIGEKATAEGYNTNASGDYSHAEGEGSEAIGIASHAEGKNTLAFGFYSHAEGIGCLAEGVNSHAEGCHTIAEGVDSHAEGSQTRAFGRDAHAEGTSSSSTSDFETDNADALLNTWTSSLSMRVFGAACGDSSHSEGCNCVAYGKCSHAEGYMNLSKGEASHAEGFGTYATGDHSHAEGEGSEAIGIASHAEGENTTAAHRSSHAAGYYTTTSRFAQTVVGEYNADDKEALFIVGAGSDSDHRANILAVRPDAISIRAELSPSDNIYNDSSLGDRAATNIPNPIVLTDNPYGVDIKLSYLELTPNINYWDAKLGGHSGSEKTYIIKYGETIEIPLYVKSTNVQSNFIVSNVVIVNESQVTCYHEYPNGNILYNITLLAKPESHKVTVQVPKKDSTLATTYKSTKPYRVTPTITNVKEYAFSGGAGEYDYYSASFTLPEREGGSTGIGSLSLELTAEYNDQTRVDAVLLGGIIDSPAFFIDNIGKGAFSAIMDLYDITRGELAFKGAPIRMSLERIPYDQRSDDFRVVIYPCDPDYPDYGTQYFTGVNSIHVKSMRLTYSTTENTYVEDGTLEIDLPELIKILMEKNYITADDFGGYQVPTKPNSNNIINEK